MGACGFVRSLRLKPRCGPSGIAGGLDWPAGGLTLRGGRFQFAPAGWISRSSVRPSICRPDRVPLGANAIFVATGLPIAVTAN